MELQIDFTDKLNGIAFGKIPITIERPENLIHYIKICSKGQEVFTIPTYSSSILNVSERKDESEKTTSVGDIEKDIDKAREKHLTIEQINRLYTFEKLAKALKAKRCDDPKMNEYSAKVRMRDLLRCCGYKADFKRLQDTEEEFQKTIQDLIQKNSIYNF